MVKVNVVWNHLIRRQQVPRASQKHVRPDDEATIAVVASCTWTRQGNMIDAHIVRILPRCKEILADIQLEEQKQQDSGNELRLRRGKENPSRLERLAFLADLCASKTSARGRTFSRVEKCCSGGKETGAVGR